MSGLNGFMLILLSLFVDKIISLQDSDINTLNASNPIEYGSIGPSRPVCAMNYDTNTIYMIGGSFNNFSNTFYITLDYLNESSSFINNKLLDLSVLTSIQGFTTANGLWYCSDVSCGSQIGRAPYIYIVGAYTNEWIGGVSMLIFDINNNQYLPESNYTAGVPGITRHGII